MVLIQGASSHPIHVSVASFDFTDDSLTVSVKLFSDDFLLALEHNYGRQIQLSEISDNQEWVDQYISSSLGVILNNSDSLKFSNSRIEFDEEAVWILYKAPLGRVRNLKIFNTLLLDLFFDQTNLVIINYRNKQNGYRFNYKTIERNIKLK